MSSSPDQADILADAVAPAHRITPTTPDIEGQRTAFDDELELWILASST
jgi:hypothetical protein